MNSDSEIPYKREMNSIQPALIFFACVLIFIMAGCAANKPIVVNDSEKIIGKITAIDRNDKTLTLQDNKGGRVTVQIYNLANDSDMDLLGKSVEVQLQRSISLSPGNVDKEIITNDSLTTSAYVELIDFKEKTLFLKQRNGSIVSLEIKENMHQFDKVKKGDRVQIHYSDSVVILER